MRNSHILLLLVVTALVISGKVFARKPTGAYIQGAKIEIISGEEERYKTAIAFLDTVSMEYGPVDEALYWMSEIYVDLMNKRSNLKEKMPYAEKFAAYRDSLRMCCESKDIKSKYRKKCDELLPQVDSNSQRFWVEFYNAAVKQISELDNIMRDLNASQDSSEKAYFSERLEAQLDSCKDNMRLANIIDSTDPRTYLGLASAYEKQQKYEEQRKYLLEALDKTNSRLQVLLPLAYTYINTNDYCGSIPYFEEFVDTMIPDSAMMADSGNVEAVVGTLENLGICYNNCQKYDSAYITFRRLLELNPDNANAYTQVGRYHSQIARNAADSANAYKDKGDESASEKWQGLKEQHFDSALVFFKKAFELKPNDKDAAEEYGIIAAVRQDFESARDAFVRATKIDSTDAENWTSLGDCNLRLKDFQGAANAYEKVVELEPKNKDVIESLVAIHTELGNKKKAAEYQKKLETF